MILQKRSCHPTIVAAISGGVDSAVAAALSKSDCGVFMSNWSADGTSCSEREERDARLVAQHMKIPLRRVSLAAEYWVQVFEPYVNSLDRETGNPDVACNRYIKFGALKEKLSELYGKNNFVLVTGHYARLWQRDNQSVPKAVQATCTNDEIDWLNQWMMINDADNLLLQAADKNKDQSYFLATCQADALRQVMFPIGDICSKQEVRSQAQRLGLPNAHKRDSVGLCFVPQQQQRSFAAFLSEYLEIPTRPVQFIDVDTHDLVGETQTPFHAIHYTRGQGAKIGGTKEKYFCVATHQHSNSVMVCRGTHHPALYSNVCYVDCIFWWTGKPPFNDVNKPIRMLCRTRHLVPLVPATLVGNTVHLDTPVRAITPGQFAVFYVGVVCLGGAKIVGYGNA